jgi:pilus assembly protein Flp/PilA
MQTHRSITSTFRGFLRDDNGATAIEYAMIAAGIAVAVVATVTALGSSVTAMFTTVKSAYPG